MSFVNSKKGTRFDMEKKIVKNKKYEHVQPTVDTGASMSKYMKKIEDIRQNYRYRKDEIFKRMKISTFVQLIIQVERLREDEDPMPHSVPPTPGAQRPDTADREVQAIQGMRITPAPSLALSESDYGYQVPDTQRSSLQSVIRGVGEEDVKHPEPTRVASQPVDCPYLLLDMRDADEYEACHIITARSYPKANLSRATNYETKEMLQYRNVAGKIVVIYDQDEMIATTCARTLVERGYDNLFMLSGGLKVAYKLFPEGLLTGTAAPSITKKEKPDQYQASSQDFFTREDVDKMEFYLDSALQDKSLATSSRLSQPSSRNSNASSRASAMSRQTDTSSRVSHKKPFVPV